jgi:hypothetical protein
MLVSCRKRIKDFLVRSAHLAEALGYKDLALGQIKPGDLCRQLSPSCSSKMFPVLVFVLSGSGWSLKLPGRSSCCF